jgi:hypothetical protein
VRGPVSRELRYGTHVDLETAGAGVNLPVFVGADRAPAHGRAGARLAALGASLVVVPRATHQAPVTEPARVVSWLCPGADCGG